MSFIDFIQSASPDIGGRVARVLDSGSAFLAPDMRLPMTNGELADSFYVPRHEAAHLSEGASVTFHWASPGEPGVDPRTGAAAAPEASNVRMVTDQERNDATHHLRIRQKLLGDLQDLLDDSADIDAIVVEAEEVLSDPGTAISAALAAYKRARELVQDQTEAEHQLKALQSEIESVDGQLAAVRELQSKVAADERRLAPLREFAASVRFNESAVGPREADTPNADATLEDLDRTLAPLATDFARRTALVALLTVAVKGRLLLLDGPVGTGKSSLAERIALSCGGRCEVIPVRPAWVEPSDLLGFFDPMSRVFRPGPFTDAVASPLADRLNVVVLDEMNLARVENYAADILSRVERMAAAHQAGTTPDGIPSWSPAEWHALKAEWDILASLDAQTPETAHRVSQLRHTFQYQPRLTPTDGIALVGTLNTDDTTYDVSPKVIDRSFAIAFPPAALGGAEDLPAGQRHGLSVRRLRGFVSENRHGSHDALWRRLLDAIDEETMAALGVPYSYRIVADFDCFTTIGGYLDVAPDDLLAMFVFSRVLPRIRFFKDENRTEAAQAALERVRELRKGESDRAWDGLIDRLDNQCRSERIRVVRFWHGDSA